MITIFQDRHSGMNSRQAILPVAFRVNANLLLVGRFAHKIIADC
jgi:hypothetical protein